MSRARSAGSAAAHVTAAQPNTTLLDAFKPLIPHTPPPAFRRPTSFAAVKNSNLATDDPDLLYELNSFPSDLPAPPRHRAVPLTPQPFPAIPYGYRRTHRPVSPVPPAAIPTTPVGVLQDDAPTFISARAANSLLSENRPTRIQSEALHFLNRLLDELLLLILHSARSLATNRIKTDGVLRVLNNNLLAKNAVLEAELELRTYLDGKRAEGAKVPLGLQATSRLDGTDSFPVASAYNLLRNRCEVYSTLNDHEDDTAAGDQHIMSAEGRPVATLTPGVAIYVTAVLEFVGEYVLQGMARVIERDNSDEASLTDFRAAMTEDEALSPFFSRLIIADELKKRMDAIAARRQRRVANASNPSQGDDLSRGVRPETRSSRPWQVPNNSEDMEEAANIRSFGRRTSALLSGPGSARPGTASGTNERGTASVSGHGPSQDYKRESLQSVFTSTASTTAHGSVGPGGTSVTGSTAVSHGPSDSVAAAPGFVRRLSNDGKGFGIFSGKRRGSLRQSQDVAQSGFFAKEAKPKISIDSSLNPEDDFEALMLSGQTMKVSLTPNRLRTIEVPDKAAAEAAAANAAKLSQRTRPGTLNTDRLREADNRASTGTPSPQMARSSSVMSDENSQQARPPSRSGSNVAPARPSKIQSPPPSSYRGPGDSGPTGAAPDRSNGAATPTATYRDRDETVSEEPSSIDGALDSHGAKPFPRIDSAGVVAEDEMATTLKSHPSGQTTISTSSSRHAVSPSLDFARRGVVGGVVRNLFSSKRASKDVGPSASPSLSARSYRGGPYSNGHASADHVASSVDLHTPSTPNTTQDQAAANVTPSAGGSLGRQASQSRKYATSLDLQERDENVAPSQVRRKEIGSLGPAIAERPGTVMGVYGEPVSREQSPPPVSGQPRQEPPSRKVPWSYARRSSGNLGRQPSVDERLARGSTTSINDLYASSADHSGARAQFDNGGHTHNPSRDTYGSLPHSMQDGKVPPTAAEIFTGSSSAYAAGMVPLALLLDLEQRMKACTTVTDCQSLLATYIEDASAGRMTDIAARVQATGSMETAQAVVSETRSIANKKADEAAAPAASFVRSKGGPVLAMADDWVLEENTPLWNNHASIAGWLLDGESSPIDGLGVQHQGANTKNGLDSHADEADGVRHEDSVDSYRHPGSERLRRPSAVSTANSTYKDAEE
ncbi:hypothetical protein OC846_005261 [Tilletia horrida]|uniref:Uncharacterized protein n=1 Tax=Tilletia horrida TaxID=155126 RepID=A0AAN6GL52_9BASI|nr:hypothetical protein OC845_004935 [Tilletia horrida]KAK0546464.1 hypothetical protein OC846_005261 [Tilletia horrida]